MLAVIQLMVSFLYKISTFFCTVAVNPEHNTAACFSLPDPDEIPDNSFR